MTEYLQTIGSQPSKKLHEDSHQLTHSGNSSDAMGNITIIDIRINSKEKP